MFAAIDDIHHRNRQTARRGAADIAKQRLTGIFGSGLGHGQRHAQNGIGPQARFVGGAVHVDHHFVDGDLFGGINPQ